MLYCLNFIKLSPFEELPNIIKGSFIFSLVSLFVIISCSSFLLLCDDQQDLVKPFIGIASLVCSQLSLCDSDPYIFVKLFMLLNSFVVPFFKPFCKPVGDIYHGGVFSGDIIFFCGVEGIRRVIIFHKERFYS